jgi:hypothetical protein
MSLGCPGPATGIVVQIAHDFHLPSPHCSAVLFAVSGPTLPRFGTGVNRSRSLPISACVPDENSSSKMPLSGTRSACSEGPVVVHISG